MEGPIIGVICFFGVLTVLLVGKIYWHVIHVERAVGRIARQLGVDVLSPGVLSDRVKEAANDPDRKIEAIKLFREETGAGLAEAKMAVEQYIRSVKT
jgi:ribosomal protein L7/L12